MMKRYLSRITRELRKLEATTADRPIARRNARKRVLGAMRSLRKAIDEAYPAIVDRTGVKRLKTFAGRLARAKKTGWVQVAGSSEAGYFAAAGVRVKRLEHMDDGDEKNGRAGEYHVAWLIPVWAKAIGNDPTKLRKALKSRAHRSAALVEQALTEPSE
jgi:hypothetical protein